MSDIESLNRQAEGGKFRRFVRGLRRGCVLLAIAAGIIVCANWLFQALPAAMGFHASLNSPNALVVNAQMAFWPLVILALLLAALEFLSTMAAGAQYLGTAVAILLALTILESFLGDSVRREIFPGTDYFWNHIWPMVWASILLGIVLLTAYICVKSRKYASNWRDKLGTVLVVLSTIPAVIAFLGLVLPNMEDISTNAMWALALYLPGIALITTARDSQDAVTPQEQRGLRLLEEQR